MWRVAGMIIDGKVQVVRETLCLAGILSAKPLTCTALVLNSLPLIYAILFAVMVIVNESCTRETKLSESGLRPFCYNPTTVLPY